MNRLLVLVAGCGLCFAALAQQYKWVDQNGRTQYGDNPPPGVKATPLRGSSGAPPAPASGETASKPAAKALTPTEQEAAYRQRQKDAQKAAEKANEASNEDASKKDNCARAQEYLRTLESGIRVTRTDNNGERVYLEDNERATEAAKARQMVQQSC